MTSMLDALKKIAEKSPRSAAAAVVPDEVVDAAVPNPVDVQLQDASQSAATTADGGTALGQHIAPAPVNEAADEADDDGCAGVEDHEDSNTTKADAVDPIVEPQLDEPSFEEQEWNHPEAADLAFDGDRDVLSQDGNQGFVPDELETSSEPASDSIPEYQENVLLTEQALHQASSPPAADLPGEHDGSTTNLDDGVLPDEPEANHSGDLGGGDGDGEDETGDAELAELIAPAESPHDLSRPDPGEAEQHETESDVSDTPAIDDDAAAAGSSLEDSLGQLVGDTGDAFSDALSGKAGPSDGEEEPDIGDLPRLYLNSPMRNIELMTPEHFEQEMYADRLVDIDEAGKIIPPKTGPRIKRSDMPAPAPFGSAPHAPHSQVLPQASGPVSADDPEAAPEASEAADIVASDASNESSEWETAEDFPPDGIGSRTLMPQEIQAQIAQARADEISKIRAETDAIRRQLARPDEEEESAFASCDEDDSEDTWAVGEAAAPAAGALDDVEPEVAKLVECALETANEVHDFTFDADAVETDESFGDSTPVVKADAPRATVQDGDSAATDASAAVEASAETEEHEISSVAVAPVVEKPIVPRKSSKGHTTTVFETEIRKLIFDPVVGTQIAELFERVAEDCPHHGSFVVMSTQVESHVSEILGCMALVHALGNKKNVLLVDANSEKHSLSNGFRLQNEQGFTDACAENSHWRSVVHPTATARLSIVPAGTSIDELSNRAPVISILGEMAEEYDMVMVDAGKFDSQFALPLCHAADRNYLLVRLGKTPRELAKSAIDIMRANGVELNGTIVTNVPVGEAS